MSYNFQIIYSLILGIVFIPLSKLYYLFNMQLISNSDISKVEFISTKRQYIKRGYTTQGCLNKRPNMEMFNYKYSFNQLNLLPRFKSSLTLLVPVAAAAAAARCA